MGLRKSDAKTRLKHHQGSTRMKFLRNIPAAATLAAATNIALAQEQPTGAPGATAAPTEEVIITGTRRTDRTLTASRAPIDVWHGNDLPFAAPGRSMDH